MTLNLERICKDFGRITSDNVDPGGSINTQLGKDQVAINFGRIASDNVDPGGVDRHSTWKGSATDFGRIASDNVDPGWGVD